MDQILNENKKETELDILLGKLKLLLNDECLKIVEFLKDSNVNISPVTYNLFLNIICETVKKVLIEKFTKIKYLEEESREYKNLKESYSTLKDDYAKVLHALRQAEFQSGGLTEKNKNLENDINSAKDQIAGFNSQIDQIKLNYSFQLQTYKDENSLINYELDNCKTEYQSLLSTFSDFQNEHANCTVRSKNDSDEIRSK